MDTLTHGLAGALLARALPSPVEPKLRARETWTGFAAAMFPDADALLSPFSTEFYLAHHRGLSHSFVLLPAWAILLGAIAAARPIENVPRAVAFRRLALVSGLGVLSHILLDWITSFGTMFLSPVSWTRFALDWVFILDGPLTALLGIPLAAVLLLASRGRDRGAARTARAGLVAASLWIAFCATRHAAALELLARLAPPDAHARAAIPQPLSASRWLLLWDDGTRVTAAFVDLSRRAPDRPEAESAAALERIGRPGTGIRGVLHDLPFVYRSPDDLRTRSWPKADGPLAARALAGSARSLFGGFARFPIALEEPAARNGRRVVFRDLRFGYLSPAVDRFTFVEGYDAAGRLVSAGFPSSKAFEALEARTP